MGRWSTGLDLVKQVLLRQGGLWDFRSSGSTVDDNKSLMILVCLVLGLGDVEEVPECHLHHNKNCLWPKTLTRKLKEASCSLCQHPLLQLPHYTLSPYTVCLCTWKSFMSLLQLGFSWLFLQVTELSLLCSPLFHALVLPSVTTSFTLCCNPLSTTLPLILECEPF